MRRLDLYLLESSDLMLETERNAMEVRWSVLLKVFELHKKPGLPSNIIDENTIMV